MFAGGPNWVQTTKVQEAIPTLKVAEMLDNRKMLLPPLSTKTLRFQITFIPASNKQDTRQFYVDMSREPEESRKLFDALSFASKGDMIMLENFQTNDGSTVPKIVYEVLAP
jgi:hypothetical protein